MFIPEPVVKEAEEHWLRKVKEQTAKTASAARELERVAKPVVCEAKTEHPSIELLHEQYGAKRDEVITIYDIAVPPFTPRHIPDLQSRMMKAVLLSKLRMLCLVVIVGILSVGLEGCMYRTLWHNASREKIRVVGNAPELYVVRVDTSYSVRHRSGIQQFDRVTDYQVPADSRRSSAFLSRFLPFSFFNSPGTMNSTDTLPGPPSHSVSQLLLTSASTH